MSEEQNILKGNSKEQIPNPNKEKVNEHFPEDRHALEAIHSRQSTVGSQQSTVGSEQ